MVVDQDVVVDGAVNTAISALLWCFLVLRKHNNNNKNNNMDSHRLRVTAFAVIVVVAALQLLNNQPRGRIIHHIG